MLEYVNQDEYYRLLGESIPNNFKKLVKEASAFIKHNTSGRIDTNNIPEEVKFATCLIIQLISEEKGKLQEIQNLKSENIEGWSKTYATPEEIKKEYFNKKEEILSDYLWNILGTDGKPLLYLGVC